MVQQQIVCVLGMHRSGTSLLTRVLNLLGVDLGPEAGLTTEPVVDNPRGYWEHQGLTLISDAIIKRYGGTWDNPPVLPVGWESDEAIDDLRRRAGELIGGFSASLLWGWKDPRTCLTLPFWQQLLPEMRYVICLRKPVDVAASLAKRDDFTADKSLGLWCTYVASALKHSEGRARLCVFYEDLLSDTTNELARLAAFVGTSEETKSQLRDSIADFVDPNLQHHHSAPDTLVPDSTVGLHATSLYLALRATESVARNANVAFDTESILRSSSPNLGSDQPTVNQLLAQVETQARALRLRDERIAALEEQLPLQPEGKLFELSRLLRRR
jgi:hypothetical protein